MKRSIEIELEAARIQRSSWEQKRLEVEAKLKDIENLKVNTNNKAQEDFNYFKRQFEADFDDEKRKIYTEKYELQALRETLNQELEKIRENEIKAKEQGKELITTNKKIEYYKEESERLAKELNRHREELRLVSETSRRDLDLLTFKDQELEAIKNECKAYKELYTEQKESLKKYEANQQLLLEKLAYEIPAGKNTIVESDFMAERKSAWKKLEKESLDIKKDMIEVFSQSSTPFEIQRMSYRPPYKSSIPPEIKYRTEKAEKIERNSKDNIEVQSIKENKSEQSANKYDQFISDKDSQLMLEEFKNESEEEIEIKPTNKSQKPIEDFKILKIPAAKIEEKKPVVIEKFPEFEFNEENSGEEIQKESVESSSHEDPYF